MDLNSLYRGLGMHSDAYADIQECYSEMKIRLMIELAWNLELADVNITV